MFGLPRLAIGSLEPNVDPQPIAWALMSLFSQQGQRVQHFHSTACFPPLDGAPSATGSGSRHLDSWLMSPDICREVFAHGASGADLNVVSGPYRTARSAEWTGGQLDDLCDCLDLPRLAVIDLSQLDTCQLPPRPTQAEALLLDNVINAHHAAVWQTTLEALWKLPVLGTLDALPAVRSELAGLQRGAIPQPHLCHTLAQSFAQYAKIGRLRELAARREFPAVRTFLFQSPATIESPLLKVAVAFDDAFRCYFADVLDLLELYGATVVDFSPLCDEALPPDTDLVYLGCGHPERYAARLASNHCMLVALREHVCAGRRIYAEGGGLAYLCEHLVTPAGERQPMVGAIRATATAQEHPAAAVPWEVTLKRKSWLGRSGTSLRGYLSDNWRIEATGACDSLTAENLRNLDLVGRYRAIGSRMHVNFVAQSDLLQSFLRPSSEPIHVP